MMTLNVYGQWSLFYLDYPLSARTLEHLSSPLSFLYLNLSLAEQILWSLASSRYIYTYRERVHCILITSHLLIFKVLHVKQ